MTTYVESQIETIELNQIETIGDLVQESFSKIAPFWPLQNLIAVNPLQGFEDLPIEEALKIGAAYFERSDLPDQISSINIQTIKWLQIYFDEGEATIKMPFKKEGFYTAWKQLAEYDAKLHKNRKNQIAFLKSLPQDAEESISVCLEKLQISKKDQGHFLTLLLTTLPGWASYIKYRTEWFSGKLNSIDERMQMEYLAIRLIITALIWPEAKQLLDWHNQGLTKTQNKSLEKIEEDEDSYRLPLLRKLVNQKVEKKGSPDAQLVFCIDVRSESFRKNLESTGNYETLGFAGFFGIPTEIIESQTGNCYSSCPVLLKPKHKVIVNSPLSSSRDVEKRKNFLREIKKSYQSLKYGFSTPFCLVETIGGLVGIWMGIRTLLPKLASKIKGGIKNFISFNHVAEPLIDGISFESQCLYAEGALRMMGLTDDFAPLILFCGHGSATENNAYGSALDCGACGGRCGGNNGRILAAILNRKEVKKELSKNGIYIPKNTQFIGAEHNTTTDEMKLYCQHGIKEIEKLKKDLETTRKLNCAKRLKKMKVKNCTQNTAKLHSYDWAQVRAEWGLARNAAFIVAPRDFTSLIDLDGRCFLHSYDYKKDPEGKFLTTILTAPMVVAEWINTQYLFSTMNNAAYGGGSKITKNITGKMGVMQGNASDLMTGLPLQSIYENDRTPYHEPQRLMVVVLAPEDILNTVIEQQPILQKLFGNGWVQMVRVDPDSRKFYFLDRDFVWQERM